MKIPNLILYTLRGIELHIHFNARGSWKKGGQRSVLNISEMLKITAVQVNSATNKTYLFKYYVQIYEFDVVKMNKFSRTTFAWIVSVSKFSRWKINIEIGNVKKKIYQLFSSSSNLDRNERGKLSENYSESSLQQ